MESNIWIKSYKKELKVGDEILIIGDKTGAVKSKITKLKADKDITIANKNDLISFPLDDKIRKNDKLYVLES